MITYLLERVKEESLATAVWRSYASPQVEAWVKFQPHVTRPWNVGHNFRTAMNMGGGTALAKSARAAGEGNWWGNCRPLCESSRSTVDQVQHTS